MKDSKVRIALTNGGNVLVVHRESELYNLLRQGESVVKTLFGEMPDILENFFKLHQSQGTFRNERNATGDVKVLFDKFFSYYVTCKVYNQEIDQKKYGLLKRFLSKFGQKLWRKILSISGKIARVIINFQKKQYHLFQLK